MEKKKKASFPKGFFKKERPTISLSDSLKDVIPVEWVKKRNKAKKKTILN